MELELLFKENGYESVKFIGEGKKLIESFTVNFGEKDLKYSDILKDIYLHKTGNEMFIILDCISQNLDELKKVCEEWENYVLNFVNLDEEFRDNINYLKYNITLIILCRDDKNSPFDDDFRFKMEKSVRICRKLFLLCDENDAVLDNEWRYLPFYNSTYELPTSAKLEECERELENLLPDEKSKIFEICKKNELTDDDKNSIFRWLISNENN